MTLTPSTVAPSDPADDAKAPDTRRLDRLDRLVRWVAVPDHAAALVIFVVALTVGMWNVSGSPAYQDDEGTYVSQAVAVQNGDLAPYTYWYDHPPLGWIQLAVLGWLPGVLGLGGGSEIAAMRHVMALLFAVTTTLVFLIGRRIRLALPFAALASAVFVLSPLSITLGRQVFLDGVGLPWILAAFYLALTPRKALWQYVGAGMSFALAVLSKLTLAVFGPALLLAILSRGRWPGRGFALVGFLTLGGLVMMMFPLMALLRGELAAGADHVSLQEAFEYQFLSRSGSGWLWEDESSRRHLLQGWLEIDPFIVIAGTAGAALCVVARRRRWITVAVLSFAMPIVASQGYLPAMYIVGVLPFLALGIGAGADLVWRWARAVVHRMRPSRSGGRFLMPVVIAGVLAPIPLALWAAHMVPLMTADDNADWRRTLTWIDETIPRDDVIAVPYSMWQEVERLGWDGPWRVIAIEKIDLDSQFEQELPGGWTDIDWIIEGPTVSPNITYLGLETVKTAMDNSHVVASFGAWHVREVTDPSTAVAVIDDTTTEQGESQG